MPIYIIIIKTQLIIVFKKKTTCQNTRSEMYIVGLSVTGLSFDVSTEPESSKKCWILIYLFSPLI